MKFKLLLLSVITLSLLSTSQQVFAQTDVNVGGDVDREDPTITIINPINGAKVSGTVSVNAQAADDSGIVRVEFFIDGKLKATDTTSPYTFSWNTKTVSDGNHTIVAKAVDTVSKTAEDSITVTVDNDKNVITSPKNNIQDPVIGPPRAATPSERVDQIDDKKTTLLQIPDEESRRQFIADNKDFLLGTLFGFEVLIISLLIYFIRHKRGRPDSQNQ